MMFLEIFHHLQRDVTQLLLEVPLEHRARVMSLLSTSLDFSAGLLEASLEESAELMEPPAESMPSGPASTTSGPTLVRTDGW